MKWQVLSTKEVRRRLARIPEPDRGRLVDAMETLKDGPEAGDVRPLSGRSEYRLRVGRWRILFEVYEEERTIVVQTVGPRGDVYK